jgi:hypothetical protein
MAYPGGNRPLRRQFILGALFVATFAVLIVGCGDDDKTSSAGDGAESREYFEQALAISQDVNSRIGSLKTTYPDGYLDVADKASFDLQQTRDSYQDYLQLYREYLDRNEALDPPEPLKQLHDENLSVNRDVNAINERRLEPLLAARSATDLEAAFAVDEEFNQAVVAADEVCNEFRDLALDSGVDWDQPCQLD